MSKSQIKVEYSHKFNKINEKEVNINLSISTFLKNDFTNLRPIAQRQIYSLYKRMKFHPEKSSLYKEEILKIINDEKEKNEESKK